MNQQDLKIYFVCDAGMGSSALGASLLQRTFKKHQLNMRVQNCSVSGIPYDADFVIAHENFMSEIKRISPSTCFISVNNFMDEPIYERIVTQIMIDSKNSAILSRSNIKVNCKAKDSDEAIVAVGELLKASGYIEEAYIQGMLNRDHSLTTYIGNDLAIPHGEYEVKEAVLKTGLAVMIYPDGIKWANGNVRIVIGIAAKNDDHMMILANIASKLCEMETVEEIVKSQDIDFIYEVLTSEEDEA